MIFQGAVHSHNYYHYKEPLIVDKIAFIAKTIHESYLNVDINFEMGFSLFFFEPMT